MFEGLFILDIQKIGALYFSKLLHESRYMMYFYKKITMNTSMP